MPRIQGDACRSMISDRESDQNFAIGERRLQLLDSGVRYFRVPGNDRREMRQVAQFGQTGICHDSTVQSNVLKVREFLQMNKPGIGYLGVAKVDGFQLP